MLKILKILIPLVVVVHSATTLELEKLDKNQTISIIAGLINGVIEKDHLQDIQECLSENEEITDLLSEIRTDLESKNINAMFEGLRLVGKLIINVPAQLSKCENVTEDLKEFKEWAKIFTQPDKLYNSLMTNLPTHFTQIWDDIQDANEHFKNGSFYEYGRDLGESMVLAVGKVEQQHGILGTIDKGYEKFKDWFDTYIWSGQEKKSVAEDIDQGVANLNPFKESSS